MKGVRQTSLPDSRTMNIGRIVEYTVSRNIGIMGTGKGCGTTHIAVMTAKVLSGTAKTAFLDMGGCGISCLSRLMLNKDEGYFRYSHIDFFPDADIALLAQLEEMEYEYMVMDFGVYNGKMPLEYLRCYKRYLVTCKGPLGFEEYEHAIKDIKEHYTGGRGCVLFNHATPDFAKKIRAGAGVRACAVGFEPELFKPSKDFSCLIERMIIKESGGR